MKFTVERAILIKALAHVQSVVERRNTIPILANVLLAAQDDPEGRRVLDAYRGVTRYDLLEGAAAIEVASVFTSAAAWPSRCASASRSAPWL